MRGDAGVESGYWVFYKTCILAPQAYLSRVTDANTYDMKIPYESIRDWFQVESNNAARSHYKSQLMQEAIDQNRRGYSPKADELVSQFWESYWRYASEKFPILSMQQPAKKPGNSRWIRFMPAALGAKKSIIHKLDKGYVDLQIDSAGERVESLEVDYKASLDQDMEIVRTGKSASIRISVPPIDLFKEFEQQIDSASAGLDAATRLLSVAGILR
jgi:hypothetical protein